MSISSFRLAYMCNSDPGKLLVWFWGQADSGVSSSGFVIVAVE